MKTAQLKRKIREYKDFLYPLIVLGVLLVLLKGFFLPKISEIVSFRQEREALEKEIRELSSYLSYLQESAGSTLPIEEEVVNYALPPEKDIVSLIVTFEGLGRIEGVSLEPFSLKPGLISQEKGKSGEDSSVSEIDFQMKAEAEDEEAAKKLLEEILLSRRILKIKKLKWSLSEEGKITLELSLSAYYLPNFAVQSSRKLVKQGALKHDFLQKLKKTKVYEKVVSEEGETGKEDLFSL